MAKQYDHRATEQINVRLVWFPSISDSPQQFLFTFKCALMSFGSRSCVSAAVAVNAFSLWDRIGSMDLLNSSWSMMMLVSDLSFSRPMVQLVCAERREQLVSVRCALCAGTVRHPAPCERSAARGRGDTTSSQSLPQRATASHQTGSDSFAQPGARGVLQQASDM